MPMRDISDRSIRNITVKHKNPPREVPPPPRPPRRRRSKGRWLFAVVVLLVAAVLGLLLSTVFAGASVVVTPRSAEVALPASIPAQQNAPVGTLSYQTVSVSRSATTTAPAKGQEQVQKQAQGEITISNTTSQQRLIANTRFEAPDGKIYRIKDSIVVPGGTTAAPGTAKTIAYADSPGPDYNRGGTTSYTVPGFKGDPRYTKITASSGAMTGGFIGTQPKVADADLQNAKSQLERQLDTAARAALQGAIAEGYVLIPGTVQVTYSGALQTPAEGESASISESATAMGSILRINDLAATIAKQTVEGYSGEAVTILDPSAISMSATSTKQSSLTLALSGNATLVWVFDSNELKQKIVGTPKSQFETVITSFEPAIQKADASIRPFWTSTFPSDADKITVTVKQ